MQLMINRNVSVSIVDKKKLDKYNHAIILADGATYQQSYDHQLNPFTRHS